jgi:hypothetical protein
VLRRGDQLRVHLALRICRAVLLSVVMFGECMIMSTGVAHAAASASAGRTTASPPAAELTNPCPFSLAYDNSGWNNGHTAILTLADTASTSWRVGFDLLGDQVIVSSWGLTLSQTGLHVQVSPIASGPTPSRVYFIGFRGSSPQLHGWTFNGVQCEPAVAMYGRP